jgi:hypothetical protein
VKALTLKQPYASLVVLGIKTWETRPSPFNGNMRPAGVRGLPGLRIDRGERIAIHAAATRPRNFEHYDVDADVPPWIDLVAMSPCWDWWEHPDFYHGGTYRWRGPLGAIVGYVTIADTLPIVDDAGCVNIRAHVCVTGEWMLHHSRLDEPWPDGQTEHDISDQLPYGHWRAGNWAMELTDPEPCDPIPAKGKQGVWEWTP